MRLRRVTEIWISNESENKFACQSVLRRISMFIFRVYAFLILRRIYEWDVR